MAFAILIPQISLFANTFFLGNYNSSDGLYVGSDFLAVSGVASIYHLIYSTALFGLASGLLILLSKQAGLNIHKNVGRYFSNGIFLGVIISLLLIVFNLLFYKLFFSLAVENETVFGLSCRFTKIRTWGLPFLFIIHLSNMLFISSNNTSIMFIGTGVQTFFEVILDYFLIYGHLSFPELGIEGAAIASVLAEFFGAMAVMFCIIKMKRFKIYYIRFKNVWDQSIIIESIKTSAPLMLQFILSIGAWEVFFIYIEHLGKQQIAASQILRIIYSLAGILVWALANTTNSMVANLLAQKKLEELIPLIKKVLKISVSYALVVVAILYWNATYFMELFSTDSMVVAFALEALPIVLIGTVMFSISSIYFNALIGIGETKRSLFYEVLVIFFYLIYVTVIIEKLRLPLWAAWTSELFYWTCIISLSATYIHRKRWLLKRS